MEVKKKSVFNRGSLRAAFKKSWLMLDPRVMMRNPVMFVTEIGAALCTLELIVNLSRHERGTAYTLSIVLVLWLTVLFANFSEALAEERGRTQAASLRQARQGTRARIIRDGVESGISSEELKQGDEVVVIAGETIPGDGEILEGAAMIDESAITGESAPVLREAGGDRSGVTGGTVVLTDRLVIRISAGAGETFLDRMIALVEGAQRQKTPNELALNVTLAGLTMAFLIVTASLKPIALFFHIDLPISTLVALLVCLIPTTIGALLAAISIAGMDRALAANLLAKSGKAVELAGDIDTLLLDKTGTITMGNRKATAWHVANGVEKLELIEAAIIASRGDATAEGQSILFFGEKSINADADRFETGVLVPFTAQTKISGADLPNGRSIRKGALSAIRSWVEKIGFDVPGEIEEICGQVSKRGGTPIVLAVQRRVLGVIELSDVLKPGISQRFERLHAMGMRTVMVTGDNPLTAASIAKQAGVDDFLAEAKPEDKLDYIRKIQAGGHLVAMMGDGTNDAPALAQADIGIAMMSGTQAAKEAGNMVDLDSDPTKLIEAIEIGKQLLMTRGALTTFSIANDAAKYFAIIPAMFLLALPGLSAMNLMRLGSSESAILSALVFNAIIIPLLIPLALRGVKYRPGSADDQLRRNLLTYGLGGLVAPFAGIKLIDLLVSRVI